MSQPQTKSLHYYGDLVNDVDPSVPRAPVVVVTGLP